MIKNLYKIGVAASLAVAAIPLVAVSAAEDTATTHVRIGVATAVACSSAGNYNTTDVNLGDNVAPGTDTAIQAFTVSGATNSLSGFTITGTPTDLAHTSGPTIIYKYGTDAPAVSNWWVTTAEEDENMVTIGSTIVLTSSTSQYDFEMGAAASIKQNQFAGEYNGKIEWVCSVQ